MFCRDTSGITFRTVPKIHTTKITKKDRINSETIAKPKDRYEAAKRDRN